MLDIQEKINKAFSIVNPPEVYTQECNLLSDTKKFIQLLGCDAKMVRIEAGMTRGIADVIICIHGKFVAAELKDDSGKASPQQKQFIHDIRDAKGIAGECRHLRDVINLLREAVQE